MHTNIKSRKSICCCRRRHLCSLLRPDISPLRINMQIDRSVSQLKLVCHLSLYFHHRILMHRQITKIPMAPRLCNMTNAAYATVVSAHSANPSSFIPPHVERLDTKVRLSALHTNIKSRKSICCGKRRRLNQTGYRNHAKGRHIGWIFIQRYAVAYNFEALCSPSLVYPARRRCDQLPQK